MGNDELRARHRIVAIRCTPLERETIQAAAEAAGITVSDWIRVAIHRELDRVELPPVLASRE